MIVWKNKYVTSDFEHLCSKGTNSFLSLLSLVYSGGGTSFHRTIAVTDFEPTEARMAFPCFDEPLFKANFSIKIRRESKHIALSNMPKVLPLAEILGNSQVELWSSWCCFLKYFLFFRTWATNLFYPSTYYTTSPILLDFNITLRHCYTRSFLKNQNKTKSDL